ncbi:MAG TPA: AMP-binding protein, partial [Gemmataceae bacterium]|nr:AMP-binding protein [Gemmataceae bacterium]
MRQTPPDTCDAADLIGLLQRRAVDRREHGYAFEERAGTTRLTFADLDRRARQVARRLADVHPETESAILCYPPGVDFLIGFFGSLYAGVTAVPAYPPRPRRADSRLEAIAGDSPRAIVLTTPELLRDKERLAALTPRLRRLSWIAAGGPATEAGSEAAEVDGSAAKNWKYSGNNASRPAVLQYTSGSTALPKGVMLTQASILHNIRRMREVLGLGPDTPGVCWLPAFHDMGLIGNLLQVLYCGANLTLLSPASVAQDPLSWLKAIGKARAYVSGGPGFAFQHCLDRIRPADRDQLDLSSWRVAYVGAEPVSAAVLNRFAEYFAPCGFRPEAFFPTYGLAEGTLMITGGDRVQAPVVRTFRPASLETSQPIHEEGGRPLVGCGQPLTDLEVAIVDPATCCPVPSGEIGEIWVSGPSVAEGYWNQPEETAQIFGARRADGCSTVYLRTGDLGFLQDQLFITGRIKELIIIRGRNFYPQDLEDAVADLPLLGHHRGAAFTVDEGRRPRLILVQEVMRGFQRSRGAELFTQARKILAEQFDLELNTMVLVRTGSLPRASSGKIQRREAAARFEAGSLDVVEIFECGASFQLANADSLAQTGIDNVPLYGVTARDIRDWLVVRLARQLQRPAETIDVDKPFADFGLDSMSMVTIAGE